MYININWIKWMTIFFFNWKPKINNTFITLMQLGAEYDQLEKNQFLNLTYITQNCCISI